jgi:hypothetical protein
VDILGSRVERRAAAALAVLGISAVPSETASALAFDTGSDPGSGTDFRAGQLGGGFTWSETLPIYLEGYIGWSRYDPVFVFSDGADQASTAAKWTSVAATGGIGWDFTLTETLTFRPMLYVTLGEIISDATLAAQFVADRLGSDARFVLDGALTAGGVGAGLVLDYNRRWANDYEVDFILRHTHIHLEPIGGDRDVVGSAEAATTALWSRLRIPTGYRAFGRPVRTVSEFSASYLSGDQGAILNTDWLMQAGFGGEIDLSETGVPWVTTARAMLRYTTGEYLEGYSFGLAVSF